MKKFRFRFQTVLRHRERKEDRLKGEFAHLSRVLVGEKDILTRLETWQSICQKELKLKQTGKINGEEILGYQAYLITLNRDIAVQRGKVDELITAINRKRGDLVEVSKERKIIEKVGERDYERFRKGLLKTEQQFIDEVAGNRFISGEKGSIKIFLLLILTFVLMMGGMLFLTGSLKKENLPKLPLVGQFFPDEEEEVAEKEEKPSEIDLMLAELKKQEEEYNRRKETLDERELRLNQLEKELEERRGELSRVRDEITGNIVKIKSGERKNLQRLAKVYETMRPEESARIVKKLNDEIVVSILLLMKEKKSAGILGELAKVGEQGAERAARLSDLMRQLIIVERKK